MDKAREFIEKGLFKPWQAPFIELSKKVSSRIEYSWTLGANYISKRPKETYWFYAPPIGFMDDTIDLIIQIVGCIIDIDNIALYEIIKNRLYHLKNFGFAIDTTSGAGIELYFHQYNLGRHSYYSLTLSDHTWNRYEVHVLQSDTIPSRYLSLLPENLTDTFCYHYGKIQGNKVIWLTFDNRDCIKATALKFPLKYTFADLYPMPAVNHGNYSQDISKMIYSQEIRYISVKVDLKTASIPILYTSPAMH